MLLTVPNAREECVLKHVRYQSVAASPTYHQTRSIRDDTSILEFQSFVMPVSSAATVIVKPLTLNRMDMV